jgi:ketosteroid isomerase-like protein
MSKMPSTKGPQLTISKGFIDLLTTLAQSGTDGHALTKTDVEKQTAVSKVDEEKDHAMQAYVESHGANGGDVLDRIYADGMVFVSTRGELVTKRQRMEGLRNGNFSINAFGRDSYGFHVYGDTVIMTGRATSDVMYMGKRNQVPRQFTNVYRKINGEWKLVAHHATTIA